MSRMTSFTTNALNKYKRMARDLSDLPDEALDKFKDLTPVRSGNARRHTTRTGNTIEANYNYASKLDEGSSRQAPRGMTKPFREWLAKKYKEIIKKR